MIRKGLIILLSSLIAAAVGVGGFGVIYLILWDVDVSAKSGRMPYCLLVPLVLITGLVFLVMPAVVLIGVGVSSYEWLVRRFRKKER